MFIARANFARWLQYTTFCDQLMSVWHYLDVKHVLCSKRGFYHLITLGLKIPDNLARNLLLLEEPNLQTRFTLFCHQQQWPSTI